MLSFQIKATNGRILRYEYITEGRPLPAPAAASTLSTDREGNPPVQVHVRLFVYEMQ